jgi:regulator of sigma D
MRRINRPHPLQYNGRSKSESVAKEQGMSTQSSTATERRQGSQDLVGKLVTERTEMLATFCRLAGIEPYNASDKSVQTLLQEFCQILVDYVAAGHFAVYERILEGKERRREVSDIAAEVYERIAQTTDMALDFNDKYDCEDHCTALDSLSKDLSKLGEELALRIELEDKLLTAMARR